MDDIQEESAKYGSVRTVIIPRPSKDGSHMPGVGKVFVKYGTQVSEREQHIGRISFLPLLPSPTVSTPIVLVLTLVSRKCVYGF